MEEFKEQIVEQDLISLKDLILKVREWFRYLLSKWVTVLMAGIIGAGIGLAMAFLTKQEYVGELTFIVEGNSTNPLGVYAGLASQFGIDLGGGNNSGVFEGDNIIEFLKSRLMIERALLSPVTINGKSMSLADLYIDTYEMREKWKAKPALKSISFPPTYDRSKFTVLQDSVLQVIQDQLTKGKLKVEKIDKKLSFIKVNCTSLNEQFSKAFTEQIVDEAIRFYIDTKTKRNKTNIDRLQSQADSLELLLNRKTYSAAAMQDLNLNPARQAAGVNTEVAVRDKFMLQTMYGEVVKNLELSKIAMAQETPVIQIVDKPILPLIKQKLGKIKGILLGGIIAGIITIMWLLARKIYKETMER